MPDDQKTNAEVASKVKMSINELKYIIMEGGGARGNTYLGAVRELEVQLLNRVKAINHENHENGIEKVPKIENTGSNARKPGIMDYWKQDPNDPEKYIPIIEGVAGASAGAITTFALILGLNSDEINTVLKFDFSSFLSEIDAGKYRMIDENSELKIGEDSTLYNEPDTLFETKQKKLGGKKTKFDFDLSKNKTNVTGNPAKFAKRGLLVNFIVKVVVDGIVYNIGQLYRLFSNKEKPNWVVKAMQKIFGINSSVAKETGSSMLTRIVMYSGGLVSLFYIVFRKKKMGMRVNANSIMGVFTDRGMYSGFQIREFFFDIMIFAATRDTFFQKQLIKFFKKDYPNLSHESFEVTNKKVNNKNKSEDFVIGSRGDYNFTTEFKKLIEFHLKNMTFRNFFNILEVDFAAAVSNFTTNSPLFFSNKYTPHFHVLEAVGASMSIPPAIRPLFNASDVFFYEEQKMKQLISDPSFKNFADINGNFKRSDYEVLEYAVVKALQKHIEKKDKISIDLNNVIELNTFLNYMQNILIGKHDKGEDYSKEQWKDITVEVNGRNFIVTIEMLAFFYNAQFKGLLLDGGYFNNIPFNYFREKGNQLTLDNVLAIKLDRSFPSDFMDEVNTIMKQLKSKEREVIERVRLEEIEIGNIVPMDSIDTSDFNKEFEQAVVQIRNLLGAQVLNEKKSTLKRQLKEGNLSDDEKKRLEGIVKNFKVNRQNILKIIEEWYLHYGAYNDVKPWELPRPIIDIAFTGYAYGAKRGQIHDITDHKHIVSLYDYGVGTYDFNLDKVRSLAEFAQREAQNKLFDYFKEQK